MPKAHGKNSCTSYYPEEHLKKNRRDFGILKMFQIKCEHPFPGLFGLIRLSWELEKKSAVALEKKGSGLF